MKQVNIYIATNIRGPSRKDGAGGYILECETKKGPATISKIETLENMTQHQAELTVLVHALRRIKTACELHIFTDAVYLSATWQQGWLEKWAEAGWMNSRGEEVGNREEWEETLNLLSGKSVSFHLGEPYSYREWIARELEKQKGEHNVR